MHSQQHLRTLLRYIDQNAPKARLAPTATVYPHGSAALYAGARRPRWLSTEFVDGVLNEPDPAKRPAAYERHFGRALRPEEARIVQRRLERAAASDDDWDDLLGAAPPQVLDWMRR